MRSARTTGVSCLIWKVSPGSFAPVETGSFWIRVFQIQIEPLVGPDSMVIGIK